MAPLPKKPKSKLDRLVEEAWHCVWSDNWVKLTSLILKLDNAGTAKFEKHYAHSRNDANNRHKFRDDINTHWDELSLKQVRARFLALMQQKNPLPTKQTYEQVARGAAESVWTAKQREITRQRLKNPKVWPKGFQNAVLIKQFQQWGAWVLDNYIYLMTSPAPRAIGLRFSPPTAAGGRGADIKAISDFTLKVADAKAEQMQLCDRGPNKGPVSTWSERHTIPKGCIERLRKWKEVFSATKGEVSKQMRKKIQLDLDRYHRLKMEKQKASH